jgi:peptidoglycan/xylan/chitin deacetylase (PgdA/CDA1 family)/uncharacterized membrane protein YbhN (UPF0104 family)
MPARKRAALLLAVAAGAALLALGAALCARGHRVAGLAVAAGTLAAALAALQALWPRFDLGGRSVRRGPRHGRRVALTFDDGPGEDTPAVLRALAGAGVPATFFVLGAAARRRPELVRAVAAAGHEVALHGDRHRRLAFAGPARIARELDACAAAIRTAGVEPAPLFRAPHGWKGPLLTRALAARGLTLVGWTRGVFDTARPGVEAIVARATRRPGGGEILLLHDGCGTPGIDPRRDQTAAAVPGIVARWRAAGYEFVPVSALAQRRRGRGASRWARLRGVLAPADGRGQARRRALRLGGVAVLVGFAALALRSVDLRAVGAALAGADPGIVLAAMAGNLLSLAAHTQRWTALVPRGAGRPRFRDAFAAVTAGFAVAIVVPARAGDVVRSWMLARRAGVSTATLVAVAGLDYLVGATALVPLLGLLALATPLPGWASHALLAFALVATGGAILAAILRPRGRRAPPRPGSGRLVTRLRAGLEASGDPGALGASIAWGFAGWGAEVLIAHLALLALGMPAGIELSVLAVLAATAAGVVAVSPGGAGPFELLIVLALAGAGVPREAALAFALLYHFVHLVPVAVIGTAALVRELREAPA